MTTRRDLLKSIPAMGLGSLLTGFVPLAANAKGGRFEVVGDHFELDGKRFRILSGEMHYPRIPRALWKDRFRKLKSLGLNTVSTCVFWNAHEKTPGVYDFSGNLDVAAFIREAQEEGLWVCLRPGPYVCAEWDNSGFPSWFMTGDTVKPRSQDPSYMGPVKTWLNRLAQEVKPLLLSNGGPIIFTQIENEYGSYGDDHEYMRQMYEALSAAGFDGLFYTADGADVMDGGVLPGVTAAMNFGTYSQAHLEFAKFRKRRPDAPLFCGELWGGWFDHFGESHAQMPAEPLLKSLEWMMEQEASISFYMLHGGTSWGFYAGANYQPDSHFAPDISSYDYDALIDEAGRPTEKFYKVKALFQKYLPAEQFKPEPAPEKALRFPRVTLRQKASLSQVAEHVGIQKHPQTLESLGYDHGLMRYEHQLTFSGKGILKSADVRDYGIVTVGGNPQGTLDRRFEQTELTITGTEGDTVDMLIDVMGRVNYGPWVGKDQKGLIGPVSLNSKELTGWKHTAYPLDDLSALQFSEQHVNGPAFYKGSFTLDEIGYTYIDVREWGKGYVWVNGHNLGRYWSVGPQRSLFVPAPWLKQGENKIVVLDLEPASGCGVTGSPTPIWDRA